MISQEHQDQYVAELETALISALAPLAGGSTAIALQLIEAVSKFQIPPYHQAVEHAKHAEMCAMVRRCCQARNSGDIVRMGREYSALDQASTLAFLKVIIPPVPERLTALEVFGAMLLKFRVKLTLLEMEATAAPIQISNVSFYNFGTVLNEYLRYLQPIPVGGGH